MVTTRRLIPFVIAGLFLAGSLLLVPASSEDLVTVHRYACGSIGRALEWSPDGANISVSSGGIITILNRTNGTVVKSLANKAGDVISFAWSGNGTRIASIAEGVALIWDVENSTVISNYPEYNSSSRWPLTLVDWSPDGDLMVLAKGGANPDILLVQAPALAPVTSFNGNRFTASTVLKMAWAQDSRRVAITTVASAYTWAVLEGLIIPISGSTDGITNAVAWSPDGKSLAVSAGTLAASPYILRLSDNTVITTLKGNRTTVESLAWSSDGMRIAGGMADGNVSVWDAWTGTLIQTLPGHTGKVTEVAWSPDGRSLASIADGDENVQLWTGQAIPSWNVATYPDAVGSLALSPEGDRFATTHYRADNETGDSDYHFIRLWESSFGAYLRDFTGHVENITALRWSPDGTRIASADAGPQILVWNPDNLSVQWRLNGSEPICWSPDGGLLASRYSEGNWTYIAIWDMANGSMRTKFVMHGTYYLEWSPDGRVLASAGNSLFDCGYQGFTFYDVDESQVIGRMGGGSPFVWSPDCRLLAYYDGIMDIRDWTKVIDNTEFGSAAASPHNELMAFYRWQDRSLFLWNTTSRAFETFLEPAGVELGHLVWSENGRFLAAANRGTGNITFWGPIDRDFTGKAGLERDELRANLTIDPVSIGSGGQANITIQVASSTGMPVDNAAIDLLATQGHFSVISENGAGCYTATFTAPELENTTAIQVRANISRGISLPVSVSVSFVVNGSRPENRAPTILSVSGENITNLSEKDAAEFSVQVSDPDGDPISYEWRENGTLLGNGSVLKRRFPPGNHTLILLIGDGMHYISRPFNFTVAPPAVVPGPVPPAVIFPDWAPIAAVLMAASLLAVGSAFAAGTETGRYRLMALFLPLYTRLHKDEVLDNETRGMIRGCISTDPGIHYSEILRRLGLGNGAATYHLQALEREGLIRSRNDGRFKRFYPGEMNLGDVPSELDRIQRAIFEVLREHDGLSQREIARALDISYSSVNRHVGRMARIGVLRLERRGMSVRCYIVDGAGCEPAAIGNDN